MDIQSLIKLAHQADLEGNYRVADKLTERAIREAAGSFGRGGAFGRGGFGRGRSSGGPGGFFGAGGPDFSQNAGGANLGGGSNTTTGAIPGSNSTGRNNSGAGGPGGGGGGASATNTSTTREPGIITTLRNKKNNPDTPLTPEEEKLLEKANARNKADAERRLEAKAAGGGGGGGGRGGDNDSSIQQDNSTTSGPGGPGGSLTQTQNGRFKTRDIGGDVVGMGTMGSLALATVPTAIVAALGAYGYTMLNGRVVDQKTGQPVPPQNLPPQVQNLMSGGAKANQLALRTQANQMGDAQNAQKFIEDRRSNPAFKTAQDFYNDAVNKGLTPSMVNQVTALAKAIGYKDLTPYTN